MGGEGSGDVLKLLDRMGLLGMSLWGGTWSLQWWHSEVVPQGTSSGRGVVCLYVHVVLRSNSLSIVTV